MFHLSARVWISIFDAPKFFLRRQTLGAKSAQKCYHVGTLEAFHLWSLATSVKVQRSTSRSPPITLLDFLHLSIDWPSVKTPSSNQLVITTHLENLASILFISEVWAGNCDYKVDAEFLKLLVLIELLIMNMKI